MARKVRERVPARVLRSSDDEADVPAGQVAARRFMGVLRHPVPLSEMLQECGMNRRGSKVVIEWPPGGHQESAVRPGDLLDLEGQTYPVYGVRLHPGLYLEVYLPE